MGKAITNGEKFKEVFGYAIDDCSPADPCDMIDHTVCVNWVKGCPTCPLYNFWDKKYKKPKEDKND